MVKQHPVDALLTLTNDVASAPHRVGDTTGVYDVSFFTRDSSLPPPPQSEECLELEDIDAGLQHLADASIGLALFIDEANNALKTDDLTVDQRLHVATMISYIEGLADRLNVVRTPGFHQPKKR
jgi:hypothetical protein